jgi:hypothetical protein
MELGAMTASEPNVPQSVTVLYRGVRLGAELLALLGEERPVIVIDSAAELAKGGPPAEVILTRPFSLPELSVAPAMCAPVPDPSGGRPIPVYEVQARGMKLSSWHGA